MGKKKLGNSIVLLCYGRWCLAQLQRVTGLGMAQSVVLNLTRRLVSQFQDNAGANRVIGTVPDCETVFYWADIFFILEISFVREDIRKVSFFKICVSSTDSNTTVHTVQDIISSF